MALRIYCPLYIRNIVSGQINGYAERNCTRHPVWITWRKTIPFGVTGVDRRMILKLLLNTGWYRRKGQAFG